MEMEIVTANIPSGSMGVFQHSGQLSLLPSADWEMSTVKRALFLSGKLIVGLASHYPCIKDSLNVLPVAQWSMACK